MEQRREGSGALGLQLVRGEATRKECGKAVVKKVSADERTRWTAQVQFEFSCRGEREINSLFDAVEISATRTARFDHGGCQHGRGGGGGGCGCG